MSDPSPFVPMATSSLQLQNMANAALSMDSTNLHSSHPLSLDQQSNSSNNAQVKLENFKSWSLNTFKCAKQQISEIIGNKEKTVNKELEDQIFCLRETQSKFRQMLKLSNSLISHYEKIIDTNKQLSGLFNDLSHKNPDLHDEFQYNYEAQAVFHKNGDILIHALKNFTSTLYTLCEKTMEDTLQTVANYNHMRIEYDAYKNELLSMESNPNLNCGAKFELCKQRFSERKYKYEQLQQDVNIKIKFLEENKQKVMNRQLLAFHNALASYCNGNGEELNKAVVQVGLKLMGNAQKVPSFIEK